MSHLTEEQLILHYYGEEGETLQAGRHLDECEECRALYSSLRSVFNVVDSMPVPERGPEYGARVWRRIEARLPARSWPWRYALACAATMLLVAGAFLAGRFYPHSPAASPVAEDTQASERILRVAVGDYLERSELVLIELANARESMDIAPEQRRAQELISETRLYRQTAAATGNTSVGGILDELETLLLDIAHGPSRPSPEELEAFRARLAAESILFKIRVVNSNVRSQQEADGGDTSRQKM